MTSDQIYPEIIKILQGVRRLRRRPYALCALYHAKQESVAIFKKLSILL